MTGSLDISSERCIAPPPRAFHSKRPRIIAFCGRKRSGKDTAAAALDDFGYNRIALADPLKDMLVAFLQAQRVPQSQIEAVIYGEDKEVPLDAFNGRSARFALQSLGTAWGRDIMDQDLWLNSLLRTIQAAPPSMRFTITDVRFPNEADALRDLDACFVRVVRPGPHLADDHISEIGSAYLSVDHEILNDAASPFEFRQQVLEFYRRTFIPT